MDNGDFSPLGNDWTAKEFVKLLDGLEQFGYGNWNDVSRYGDQSKPGSIMSINLLSDMWHPRVPASVATPSITSS